MGQQQSIPGPRGNKGDKGDKGDDGDPGRSLSELTVRDGNIIATFSDGVEKNLGTAGGPQGDPGKDGRGIQSIAIDEGVMNLIYTDNKTEKVAVKELGEGALKTKTMWCADGGLCKVPEGVTGVELIKDNYMKFSADGEKDAEDGKIRAGNHYGNKALHIVGHKAGGTGRQTVIYGDVVIKGKLKVEDAIDARKTLFVSDKTTMNELSVRKDATLDKKLTVKGDLRPEKNVDVHGNFQAHMVRSRSHIEANDWILNSRHGGEWFYLRHKDDDNGTTSKGRFAIQRRHGHGNHTINR